MIRLSGKIKNNSCSLLNQSASHSKWFGDPILDRDTGIKNRWIFAFMWQPCYTVNGPNSPDCIVKMMMVLLRTQMASSASSGPDSALVELTSRSAPIASTRSPDDYEWDGEEEEAILQIMSGAQLWCRCRLQWWLVCGVGVDCSGGWCVVLV